MTMSGNPITIDPLNAKERTLITVDASTGLTSLSSENHLNALVTFLKNKTNDKVAPYQNLIDLNLVLANLGDSKFSIDSNGVVNYSSSSSDQSVKSINVSNISQNEFENIKDTIKIPSYLSKDNLDAVNKFDKMLANGKIDEDEIKEFENEMKALKIAFKEMFDMAEEEFKEGLKNVEIEQVTVGTKNSLGEFKEEILPYSYEAHRKYISRKMEGAKTNVINDSNNNTLTTKLGDINKVYTTLSIEKVMGDMAVIEGKIRKTFNQYDADLPKDKKIQRDVRSAVIDAYSESLKTGTLNPYNHVVDTFAAKYFHDETGAVAISNLSLDQTRVSYTLNSDREITEKSDNNFDRRKARKFSKKIMNRLHSTVDTSNRFSGKEKALMMKFMRIIGRMDIADESKLDGKSPEYIILNEILTNPSVLSMTPKKWDEFLQSRGIDAPRGWFAGVGYKDLPEIAQSLALSHTDTSKLPGFRRYADILLKYGSFSSAYDALIDISNDTYQDLKKTRKERFDALDKNDRATMIADFNLDGNLTYGDMGNRSGLQLKRLLDESGDTGIANLIKAYNKSRNSNRSEEDIFSSEENLTSLQEFVQRVPMPLQYVLQHGEKALDIYAEATKGRAQLLARQLEQEKEVDDVSSKLTKQLTKEINNVDTKKLSEDERAVVEELKGLSEEELRTGVKTLVAQQIAAAANNNPSMIQTGALGSVGLGVPLNDILKGLSVSVGASVNGNLGIQVGRNKSANLGKGRSIYGGVDAGLAMMTIPFASMSAGVSKTFENKQKNTSLDIKTDKTTSAHFKVNYSVNGFTGGFGSFVDANRAESLESQYNIIRLKSEGFGSGLIKALTNKDGKLNVTRQDVKAHLQEQFPDTRGESLDVATDNLMKVLPFYQGADMSDPNMVNILSQDFADSFALGWKNDQSLDLHNTGRYISGGGIGVEFFLNVIPVPVFLRFKKHTIESASDTKASLQRANQALREGTENRPLSNAEIEDNINKLSETLGLPTSAITSKDDHVHINKAALSKGSVSLRISNAMKGLMKSDADSIIIHKNTPVRAVSYKQSDGYHNYLNIGSLTDQDEDVVLRFDDGLNLPDDFSTNSAIDVDKLPPILSPLTVKQFDETKKKLIESINNNQRIEDAEKGVLVKYIEDKVTFDDAYTGTQGRTITISKNDKGNYEHMISEADNVEKNFSISVDTKEIIKQEISLEVQQTIDDIYTEASKVKSKALYEIAKKQSSPELNKLSTDRRTKLMESEYDAASAIIQEMLPLMDTYIGEGINLSQFGEKLKDLKSKDIDARNQILVALDGLFSRVNSVRGTGNPHEYNIINGKNVAQIVGENEKTILKRLEGKDNDTYAAFKKLFGVVGCKDCKDTKIESNQNTQKGSIGYNFGNADDPQRPVVNPHTIVGQTQDLDNLVKNNLLADEDINYLKIDFFTELIKKDFALIKPTLDAAGLKDVDKKDLIDGFINKKLDFDGKNYTFNYDMEFALFAQCVNHMLLMSGLTITNDSDKPTTITQEAQPHTKATAIVETQSGANMGTDYFDVAATIMVEKKQKGKSPKGVSPNHQSNPNESDKIDHQSNPNGGNEGDKGVFVPNE